MEIGLGSGGGVGSDFSELLANTLEFIDLLFSDEAHAIAATEQALETDNIARGIVVGFMLGFVGILVDLGLLGVELVCESLSFLESFKLGFEIV